ncbi:MAG: hypothetical protein BAA04_08145 [Firmicutes bacterium ZCTH02-B6]|nr:MAG: hypothetical protein BAA04_08145 [Firmicutes bacterium ZCTH02-B6]
MPVWVALLIIGLFQLVIYGVLWTLARQTAGGNPPVMLRVSVAFAGIVGLLILGAAAYAYMAGLTWGGG